MPINLFTRFRRPAARPARPPGRRLGVERLEDRTVPATLPAGFAEAFVASGLSNATSMEFSPDGRLFVTEQAGTMEVWQNGTRVQANFFQNTPLPTYSATTDSGLIDSRGERGLLGVTFDPNYATNRFVYVYYTYAVNPDGSTATPTTSRNRVARFTANAAGDLAVAGSQTVIMELDNLSGATNHNGGALHFGPDGKLYVAVGDNALGSNAQTLNNRHGKMLRINADGSIPTDNPFYATATGANRAIWALGLRNPFTFTFQPGTGRMHINDVGQNSWEEINVGAAGANYNWPGTEGYFTPPSPNPNNLTAPFYAYPHSGGPVTGFAITGGAFYNPTTAQFPADYAGDYFFADYVSSWIKRVDLSTGVVSDFASAASNPVDLRVGADGSLYYLSRGENRVYRVQYTASQAPSITQQPQAQTVSTGGSATFSVTATGTGPLAYQWQRAEAGTSGWGNVTGATSSGYTLSGAGAGDNGDQFRVVVSNSFGSQTSTAAVLTVTPNQAPSATIAVTSGLTGGRFVAGQAITFSGTGTDPEDGALGASRFTWRVDYITSINSGTPVERPFVAAFGDQTGGTFTPATTGPYTLTDVAYRVVLTVTDSGGLSTTVTRDLLPNTATLTVTTAPGGLTVTVDGQPFTAPHTFDSVAGFQRPIGAAAAQTAGGTAYAFGSWSDGGAATHTISTPLANTTYTATYAAVVPFQQDGGADGLVSVEAESHYANVAPGSDSWVLQTVTGASGGRALQALPDDGTNTDANYVTLSPRLDYRVNFVRTGVHYVWVRGRGVSGGGLGASDSVHVGLDGQAVATADRVDGFTATFGWSQRTMDGVVATINVTTLGEHTINVWMREDGFTVDKLVLTTNPAYVPTGTGPAESPRGGGNRPPVLTPPADRTVPGTQDVVTVALSATDPDGDPVTFTAAAQSAAYVLDGQLGFYTDGNLYTNFGGRQEKWFLATGGVWHFVLPSGEVYRWDGGAGATGTLVGRPGALYHARPELLFNAREAAALDTSLGLSFTGTLYENYGGRGERWLLGSGDQWYFVTPQGDLYRWDGGAGANGTLVGSPGAGYHQYVRLLYEADRGQAPAALSVSGSTLTINRDDGLAASLVISVTASDGRGGTDTETFALTVL